MARYFVAQNPPAVHHFSVPQAPLAALPRTAAQPGGRASAAAAPLTVPVLAAVPVALPVTVLRERTAWPAPGVGYPPAAAAAGQSSSNTPTPTLAPAGASGGSSLSDRTSSSAGSGGPPAWPAMSPHAAAGGGGGSALLPRAAMAAAGEAEDHKPEEQTPAPGPASRASPRRAARGALARLPGAKPSRWVDQSSCTALCWLILDDRLAGSSPRRSPLPAAVYTQGVAPFLRFDAPLPNMLYAFGGRSQSKGPLNMVEMFDTWHGQWVRCPPMPSRRAGSAAALLQDGRMMVIGGYNEKGIAEGLLASCDVYDPRRQRWEPPGAVADLGRARWGHGSATLKGRTYAVGGCSLHPHVQPRETSMETLRCCEVYDPAENRWAPCAPLQVPRSGARVVALEGERYLAAVGGCDDVFGRAETQPTVEVYDSVAGTWALLRQRLANPRTTAAAVALPGDRLFIVGGAPSLSSAEFYDVRLPRRAETEGRRGEASEAEEEDAAAAAGPPPPPQAADLPEGRMGCQAAIVSLPAGRGAYPLATTRCVVVVGGERCDDFEGDGPRVPRVKQFKCVPVYDLARGVWREDAVVPDMSLARTAVALCVGVGCVLK